MLLLSTHCSTEVRESTVEFALSHSTVDRRSLFLSLSLLYCDYYPFVEREFNRRSLSLSSLSGTDVQNGTLSNISCEASVEPNEDDRCLVVNFPTFTPHFFWGMGELHHVPEKKTSSSTTIKIFNNGPQVRFETVISM